MKVHVLAALAAGLSAAAVQAVPAAGTWPGPAPATAPRALLVRSPAPPAPPRVPPAAPAADAQPADENAALLAQLLEPLKTVTLRLLRGLQTRLDAARADDLAGVLQGPVDDFKHHLISIWPSASSTQQAHPSSSTQQAHPPSSTQQAHPTPPKAPANPRH